MRGARFGRGQARCRLADLLGRYRPVLEHLAAAHREVLLAAKSAVEVQIELLDEWRWRRRRPERVG